MGFYEDDRIRRKNKIYNLPTPSINEAARACIKELSTPHINKDELIKAIKTKLNINDDSYSKEVLNTAIDLLKREVL